MSFYPGGPLGPAGPISPFKPAGPSTPFGPGGPSGPGGPGIPEVRNKFFKNLKGNKKQKLPYHQTLSCLPARLLPNNYKVILEFEIILTN